MRFDLRAESHRKLLYGCSVLFITCLIGIGAMTRNGLLVYGSAAAGDTSPGSESSLKKESNSDAEASQAEAVTSEDLTSENETAGEDGTANEELAEPPPLSPAASVDFDFDNDGKADFSRARVVTNSGSSANEFRVRKSTDSSFVEYSLGNGTGRIAPGDFNGDGRTDATVFNAGTWTYKTTPTANPLTITLGTTGDIPVAADYDGDGTTDAAVFRPSTGVWYIKQSSNSTTVSTSWGQSGDIPVVGDYDGDGRSDFAVWRPSDGIWYLSRTTAGYYATTWGVPSTDMAVPADYDDDGKTDIAVFRRTTGVWYVRTSTSGFAGWVTQTWGNYGDQPVPADYDGDGTDDYAIWRPKTGTWWVVYSSDYSINTLELGVQGNTAVPSAYLQQVSGSVPTNELAAARLTPRNATGGTDLYSQNFSWGRSLVSLPGRAGLDLSLGIGYNSLVWTKASSEIYFDPDTSNVSPGFRLGFPTIEPIYYDTTKSKFAYMMVTTSGSRIEFRETAVSNVYETADSSYTVLETTGASNPNDPVENITITVKTTDGTQMKYEWKGGAFRCTEIKDRNGNYITITYDVYDRLEKVKDTLGREINIGYDSEWYPSTITQNWKDNNGLGSNVTRTWASFTYMSMDGAGGRPAFDTGFSGVTPVGPPDGTALKVLQKITYLDGSSTVFDYNSYAQVYKVSNIAADSSTHVLNSTEINIGSPSNPTDCPRFTSTSSIVENFNMSGSTPQAVVVTNTAPAAAANYSLTGSISINSSVVKVGVTGHPNQLYSRIHYGPSGWKEGITLATEDCTGTDSACTTRKRWTWNDFTQDNTGLSYILNPRVTESQVGDGANTKRTTVSYYSTYGLPEYVRVYDTDLATILKESHTVYNLSSAYTSRRIIGLPAAVQISGRDSSGLDLVSKMTYGYDEENFLVETNQNISSVIQHDNTNYSLNFVTGRGNLSTVTRWDADNPTNSSNAVTSKARYDIAGSVVARLDPLNRKIAIDYTDNFNDGTGRNTYAYPKHLTDFAGNSSTAKYRFDIGFNVWAKSPNLNANTPGKETTREYDDKGRLSKETVVNNGAYTRYEYPTNGTQLNTYSTVVDNDNDGADADDEVLTESLFDGAGRIRMSRVPHTFNTNGTTATWAGTVTEYDIVGRVKRQSVPTEINSSWAAAGEDATRGFLWNAKEFDWKDRVTKVIPTDSTGTDGKEQLITYEGCGCAGGQITTIKGAIADAVDMAGNMQTSKRRTRKIYEDILGRTFKTEALDLDGGTIYSTTKAIFNGRDQAVSITQYAGAEGATPNQETTAAFDGHGRLVSSHKPEQRDSSNNLKYTTYSYNADNSIQSMTDGRGVVTNYTYNSTTGRLSQISWTVPQGSNIEGTPSVIFNYDNMGNRLSMVDGLGTVNYQYNSLSQMTSETRVFNDSLPEKPSGNYQISYTYTLGGQLKSYTDPYGKEIAYTHDRRGRLNSVTGTSFAGVTSYANAPVYRAWGALKSLDYGSGYKMSQTFDNGLRALTYNLDNPNDSNPAIFDKDYEYYADGRLKLADENVTNLDKFDRLFIYDHQARVKDAKSGIEAKGQTETNLIKLPYRQTYTYSALSGVASRDSTLWNYNDGDWFFTYAYSNNRVINGGYQYDNDGRQIFGDDTTFTYDARGLLSLSSHFERNEIEPTYDGDGREGKRSQRAWNAQNNSWNPWDARYFVYSSVLRRHLTEVGPTGKKKRTYVVGAGAVVARQAVDDSDQESVGWEHRDPSGLSARTTWANNIPGNGEAAVSEELDAMGNNVGIHGAFIPPERGYYAPSFADSPVFSSMSMGDCELDGILMPCSMVRRSVEALELLVRDWDPVRGFIFTREPLHLDLPDRQFSTSVYIPGRTFSNERDGGTGEPNDPIQVGSTVEFPGEWFVLDLSWDVRTGLGLEESEDITEAARKAYDAFKEKNKACAELAKNIGLDNVFKDGKYLRPGEEELGTKLSDLGFKAKDFGYSKKDFAKLTLGSVSNNYALTNHRTKKTYLFESSFRGELFEPAENIVARLNDTIFHEALHHKYGTHIDIAEKLDLTYDKNAKDEKSRADSAEEAVNNFVSSGCVKK